MLQFVWDLKSRTHVARDRRWQPPAGRHHRAAFSGAAEPIARSANRAMVVCFLVAICLRADDRRTIDMLATGSTFEHARRYCYAPMTCALRYRSKTRLDRIEFLAVESLVQCLARWARGRQTIAIVFALRSTRLPQELAMVSAVCQHYHRNRICRPIRRLVRRPDWDAHTAIMRFPWMVISVRLPVA